MRCCGYGRWHPSDGRTVPGLGASGGRILRDPYTGYNCQGLDTHGPPSAASQVTLGTQCRAACRPWSSSETPHPAVAHHIAKFSWHCHQSKGVLFQLCQALFNVTTGLPVSEGFWYWAKMSGNAAWKWLPLSSTIISWTARESCFSLKWLPTRYLAELLNENALLSIEH